MDILAQKARQLDLLMSLDEARDEVDIHRDPDAMFKAILHILQDYFTADACAIMLIDEESDEIETLVYQGLTQKAAIDLCREAIKLEKPGQVTQSLVYNVGIHIIQDKRNQSLGGIFLSRKGSPFSRDDLDLLTIAESQIDSAVVQARMVWDIAQRNIQLEAIYQIDRMRDNHPLETDLINGFVSILADYFKAQTCMVFLSHIDSGEMILRGVIDKENISVESIDTIRELTSNINIPQVINTPATIEAMTLLAAPFIVAGVKLGSVVIGREQAFTLADHRLLYAMMSQMDSAIVHSRVVAQLQQRNSELETIYSIDKIRDSEADFEFMLQKVLSELCKAVRSEMGYLMLFEENGEQLELKASTVDHLFTHPIYQKVIREKSREALEKGEAIFSNRPNGPVRSIVAVPLILNEKVIGVFGTVNSTNPRGFNAEDRRMLVAITSQVDTAVFERLENRRMRRVLSRSVDPKVLDHLLDRADTTVLAGERVTLTTLFADLRGSTAWAERTLPEELVSTLNVFLGKMTEIIFKHGGTLDKFVGDEVIALFGSPVPMEDHALHACRCAFEMQKAHTVLQKELAEKGVELPHMGIGISSGEVIAGEFGPPIRTDFTAMGRPMNLGARLCGIAPAGKVYISSITCNMTKDRIHTLELEPTHLKGIGEVAVFELLNVSE